MTSNSNHQATSGRTLFIKMALDAWKTYIQRTDKLIDELSEEQLLADTAPGRNSGLYLFGHLVAINDSLFTILGLGERLYPQLDEPFVDSPDKTGHQMPAVSTLKEYWTNVNNKLSGFFNEMTEEKWFERHNRVSEADFINEPHRNKLNIIINRTNHLAYHLGQMVYLGQKQDG